MRRSISILALALLFVSQISKAKADQAELDRELINSVKLGEPPRKPFEFEKFKKLIEAGANVNAQDKSGQSVILLTTISHAYLPEDHKDKAPLFEALKILVARKADVNAQSFVGITPLMHAVHRAHTGALGSGHPVPKIKPVYDLLLSADPKPKLELRNVVGQTALSYLAQWGEVEELRRFISLGADIYVRTESGQNIFFSAAATDDGAKLLRDLLALVPANKRKAVLETKSRANGTPLLTSVRAAAADSVELLLRDYRVDPNVVNLGGENPLSVALDELGTADLPQAKKAKLEKIAALLKAHGAKMPPAIDTQNITCSGPNAEPFGFEKLQRVVRECKVTDLDKLLGLFPVSHRSNYVLSYKSRGIQDASMSHPRVVMMGRNGHAIYSFNGNPKHAGYKSLEMIEFNNDTKTFEFREVTFERARVQFSEKNPGKCLACHNRQHPRPNWDTWFIWPGFFESEQGTLFPLEKKGMESFKRNAKLPRYRHLLPLADSPHDGMSWGRHSTNLRIKPIKMDVVVQDLNSEAIVRQIASSEKAKPYKYAILGALSCQNAVDDFLPPKMVASQPRTFDAVLKETVEYDYLELQERIKRHMQNLPGAPQGNYAQDFLENQYGKIGASTETKRT
ncbi:MAG TPA: hypothetical protein VFV50_01875, partial [Bdellovibrionales bacterium]|nr:hypothetical protein [Bdellovibrionales bacterium]